MDRTDLQNIENNSCDKREMNLETQGRRINRVNTIFPLILLVVGTLAILATILIRRFDLTVFSLVLVVPMVLAGVNLLVNKNVQIDELATYIGKIRFSDVFWISTLIFVLSIFSLISSSTRPLTYFILIALFSGGILWQVLSKRPGWTDGLIIGEIMFLSLNLLWGVTLKYPLYFGDTDTLGHLQLIDTITKTGHIAPYYLDYQNYPLYHILVAMGIEVTGLSLKTGLFIVMGLAWQVAVLFAFLMFRQLTNSGKFAAIACLIFAASSQVIFYGSYSIARSLAFVFLMIWIYLIINKAQKDSKYLFLSLVAMTAMIMTHHLTVIFVILILFVFYLCQRLVNRSWQEQLIQPSFIYLLTISGVSYLIFAASNMTDSELPVSLRAIFSSEFAIKGSFSLTHGYGLSIVMGTLFYSFMFLLCLLGMKIVFDHIKSTGIQRTAGVFSLAGFVMLAVYIPGLSSLFPFSDVLLIDRLGLIVSPFVAFLAAYGIWYLYNAKMSQVLTYNRSIYAAILPVGLVVIMTFFSAISIGNANDTNYLPQTSTINSQYFTEPELTSFSFLNGEGDSKLAVYSDYQTTRNVLSLSNFSTLSIMQIGNIINGPDGYMVFRIGELQKKTALSFFPQGQTTGAQVRYSIDQLIPELNILANTSSKDIVYSNGDVQIYLAQHPSGS